MTSQASKNGVQLAGADLVLASGVAFFSEDFNALPHVVNALTTRSSTTEALKADANAVDRSLAKMLDKGAEALLQSTSSLSSVSNEFEGSRAKVRDLRRRVGASMASLSGRRRDLNGLSFRKAQLEHALSLLENIEVCLRASHGPISPSLGPDADALKKARAVFASQVDKRIPEDLSRKISGRFEERRSALCKLFRGRVLDSVSGQGDRDEEIVSTLNHLRDLDGLEETLADAHRHDLKHPAPSRSPQSLVGFMQSLPAIHSEFLSFPRMDSIELIVGYVQAMVEWGDILMERSMHFVGAVMAIQKTTSHHVETWRLVQDHMEKELRPLLDAFASSSSSLSTTASGTGRKGEKTAALKTSASDVNSSSMTGNSSGKERPRHYVRRRRQTASSSLVVVAAGGDDDETAASEQKDAAENNKLATASSSLSGIKFESSPYHLAFVANVIIDFCNRHDAAMPPTSPERGRLVRFLKSTCQTSLRSVVNRDVASLFHLSVESRASEFVRAAARLQTVVKELRTLLLDRVGGKGPDDEAICDSKTLLLDISHPLLHAARQRIDNAVDSQASAWIARGGTKLVGALRSDPLFLALDARRNGDPPPNRVLLMDAAFEHLRRTIVEGMNSKDDPSGGGGMETADRMSNSNLAVLVAMHGALHRVAHAVLTKDEKSEFVSVADYALFCARADVFLRVDFLMKRYLSHQQTSFPEMVQDLTSAVRHVRVMVEYWVETPAVIDFLFLPLAYQICYFLSRLIVKKNEGALSSLHLFALRSALGNSLVDTSDDPAGDLSIFDAIGHALCVRRPRTDGPGHSLQGDEEAKAYHRGKIYDCASWQHLFSNEEVEQL